MARAVTRFLRAGLAVSAVVTSDRPGRPAGAGSGRPPRAGERRWPMALAVLAAGGLRAVLPAQIRAGDARWLFLVVVLALLAALIIGDPGRIDRQLRWLRVLTGTLIGLISVVNAAAAVRLVAGIIGAVPFTTNADVVLVSGGAVWLANVIVFALWFWDLDRGGAAARARQGDPQSRLPRSVGIGLTGGFLGSCAVCTGG